MPQIVFPEFRDANATTKYPFVDNATCEDISNTIVIPSNIFIDASIYLDGLSGIVYISKISITKAYTTITITSTGGSSNTICTGTIRYGSDNTNNVIVPLYGSNATRAGLLLCTADAINYFRSIGIDTYNFGNSALPFVPTCVMPVVSTGLKTISVNTRETANTIDGDIWLIGRDGIQLRKQAGESNTIRIDVVGDPLFKKAASGMEEYKVAKPLRLINGIAADEYGNFNLTTTGADDALRIQTTDAGIKIYMAGVMNGNRDKFNIAD